MFYSDDHTLNETSSNLWEILFYGLENLAVEWEQIRERTELSGRDLLSEARASKTGRLKEDFAFGKIEQLT